MPDLHHRVSILQINLNSKTMLDLKRLLSKVTCCVLLLTKKVTYKETTHNS
jgi:hypothetical protein